MDTAYMFWALTMGILLGAGLYLIAVIVVLCIAILMFVISFAKLTTPNAYLLVVHYDEFCEAAIQSELNRSVRSSKLRSKTLTRAGAEMTYEVRISERSEVVTRMLDIEGVHDATLVACQSEVGAVKEENAMAISVPLRHELKFFISPLEYQVLSRALDRVLWRDRNGDENNEYHIRSLYFDTRFNDALLDKINGVKDRDKFRIRIYNFSDKLIRMECKPRWGS